MNIFVVIVKKKGRKKSKWTTLIGNTIKMKKKIPDYVNCNNKEIVICDYYMHKNCRENCAYAQDIKNMGIGAQSPEDVKMTLRRKIYEMYREDMRDF